MTHSENEHDRIEEADALLWQIIRGALLAGGLLFLSAFWLWVARWMA
ncbi:MAG TPA: hypothetical protein VL027_01985 [Spongiibacteraceae bacterium]|nr:hypothetical protein [Spongiibacteraceae bacterium]